MSVFCIILDVDGLQKSYTVSSPNSSIRFQSLLPNNFPIRHDESREMDAHLPSLGGSSQLGLSAGLVGAPLLEQGLRDGDLLQKFPVSLLFLLPS